MSAHPAGKGRPTPPPRACALCGQPIDQRTAHCKNPQCTWCVKCTHRPPRPLPGSG